MPSTQFYFGVYINFHFKLLDYLLSLIQKIHEMLSDLYFDSFIDFDTDEETDKLLQKQYQTDQHVDIPELSKPPINLGAQVSCSIGCFFCI